MNLVNDFNKQEQPNFGPGNAHFIFIHQMSSDAATLRRGTCCCILLCIDNLLTKVNYY